MAITARVILLMGVSGSGKTTIGRLLARRLDWGFWDADDFHPPQNVRKMAAGTPLTEEDRRPWLLRLRHLVEEIVRKEREPAVIACSALRRSYRDTLLARASKAVVLVYLKGDRATILERLQARSDHFMPPQLLDSQLETLEEPKRAVVVDIGPPPQAVVEAILSRI